MKITTRIIIGYGILIALLAGVIGYELFTIHRMQSVNRRLSGVNFQNAVSCLQLMRDRDLVDEYAQKALIVGGTGFMEKLQGYMEDFRVSLESVKAESASEQVEVARLREIWHSFAGDLDQIRQAPLPLSDFPAVLSDDLERLQTQIQTVYQADVASIRNMVEESSRTGEWARLVSGGAAVMALLVSAFVSFLIYRSISLPLSHLIEGTRAISKGKFYYRLDTSRNDEFAQLAKDFNTMTHRLNELDELKKAFISMVSHELKAPLASMRETIQLLLEKIPGPLTDKQKRLLELNLQSGVRLTSMIDNLLDLSKIEAGVMEYELTSRDLVSLARSATAELEGQATEKGLKVQTDLPEGPLWVECDGDRMIQVIVNLIGNAVKFSPRGGTVEIRVQPSEMLPPGIPEGKYEETVEPDQGGFALISVSDLGPGIPDSEKELVFERFHQVKHPGRGISPGVGLGLAISKTIVEAHGGAIWVEDNVPQGSSFRVLLRAGRNEEGVVRRSSTPLLTGVQSGVGVGETENRQSGV